LEKKPTKTSKKIQSNDKTPSTIKVRAEIKKKSNLPKNIVSSSKIKSKMQNSSNKDIHKKSNKTPYKLRSSDKKLVVKKEQKPKIIPPPKKEKPILINNKNTKKIKNALSSDTFDIPSLKKYLDSKIPHFSSFDYDIIYTIFGSKEQEYLSLIENVQKEHRSDSIICYGNNNQILKVFLDRAIKNYEEEITIKKIEINGYFDTNEETLLKEICNSLNIKSKAGYDNYKKSLDDFFLKKTQDNLLIVIYCDYIEHLVLKKRQRLF